MYLVLDQMNAAKIWLQCPDKTELAIYKILNVLLLDSVPLLAS